MFRLNVIFFTNSFIEILNIDLVANVASCKASDAIVELEKNDTLKHKLKSCMHHRNLAPRLRGPERPVLQPRDQVFWNTTLLDIELNNFLLPTIRLQEVYYNASGVGRRTSLLPMLATKPHQAAD